MSAAAVDCEQDSVDRASLVSSCLDRIQIQESDELFPSAKVSVANCCTDGVTVADTKTDLQGMLVVRVDPP